MMDNLVLTDILKRDKNIFLAKYDSLISRIQTEIL